MKAVRLLSYIIAFIFLCLVMRCTNTSEDLNVIEGRGLPLKDESYSRMIFVNEKEGYLFGEKRGEVTWKENGEIFRTNTAIVHNTLDEGRTWQVEELGEGVIINAHWSGKDLYAIKCHDSNGRDTSTVYRLNKSTNRWVIIATVDSYIRDADFSNPNAWVITKKETNGYFKIYLSRDKGATWNILLDDFVFQPVFDSTSIAFLDSGIADSGNHNILVIFDKGNGKVTKEALPSSLKASLLRKYGESLFVAGIEGDSMSIYKREKSKKYSLLNKFNFGGGTFPKEFRIYNNEIVILAGVRREMYIENHIIKSEDGGKNSMEEQLYKPTYALPIAFYGNSEIGLKTWVYLGSGKIQILK